MSENPNVDDPVVTLEEDRCWELLASGGVGRLVTVVDGRPEIYPVNFVADDRTVYFRSGPGSKLSELAVHREVAFEVDEIREDAAWSVVLHGQARILQSFDDAARLDALGLAPWVPTPKYDYVALTAHEVTGRQFALVKR
ncbi:pyridoxamine 5'-phosphate oxidase family protein [Rhodococcus sp. Z13]|uniref:Pyridoxamine 5'-phosphate oxidase family protein n=1 Tax=Rhodococcus sacchari TaxID=2962047 RepID=A0ACD4DH21_9NOCA|nr:pyridoxamine 5'-phosphate oxidase family protein [Rhodococcus sp. Z13]UYP19240.1 pyridoxamine 5'-phosphate oxidase family protein [Rhodococcus sp. Z13]